MKTIVSTGAYRRCVMVILFLGAVCASYAQEKKEPEQRDVRVAPARSEEPKAPLPKIENPEFVITGQETIDLPEAVKGDAAEASSFVPPSPSAGAKVSDIARTASKLALRNREQHGLNGKVYAAFGTYLTPSLGASFGTSYPDGNVSVNGRYASSDGYMRNTQWQSAGFGAAGSYKLPPSGDFLSESRWKSEFGIAAEQYRAFASPSPAVRRTRNDLDFGIGFDSRYTWTHPSFSAIDYSTRVSWARTSLADSAAGIENELALAANASTTYESVPVRASLEYRITDESMPLSDTRTMHWLALASDAKVMAAQNLQVSFGASALLYRGNTAPYSLRLYPRAGVRYFAAPWLTLRAGFEPAAARTSFRSVVKQNKYMYTAMQLRPSDAPLALFAGFDCLPTDEAAFSVNLEYKHVNDYLSCAELAKEHTWSTVPATVRLPFPGSTPMRVWNAFYLSDVRVLKAELRTSSTVSAAGTVTGFAVFNSTTHKDSSSQLPYVPAVSAGVVYRHSFRSSMSAEATAEYVGKRFTDFTATNANAGYLVFGAKGEYAIAGNLRLSAEIQNLFNQNYYIWNGYRERSLYVSVGIGYLW